MMKAYILKGFGIECEQEVARALRACEVFESVEFFELPKDIASLEAGPAGASYPLPAFQKGDCFVIPGGFSYSDHFGAGKLLAAKFKELKLMEKLGESEVNILGICNGFQIMCETGCFGDGVELHRNIPHGFQNRWVELLSPWGQGSMPVRHGEGRLVLKNEKLPPQTKKLLKYVDENFENGSFEKTAGLISFHKSAWRIGMMPHPEIALSKMDHPDRFGSDHFEQHRAKLFAEAGDGLQLLKNIFTGVTQESFL